MFTVYYFLIKLHYNLHTFVSLSVIDYQAAFVRFSLADIVYCRSRLDVISVICKHPMFSNRLKKWNDGWEMKFVITLSHTVDRMHCDGSGGNREVFIIVFSFQFSWCFLS